MGHQLDFMGFKSSSRRNPRSPEVDAATTSLNSGSAPMSTSSYSHDKKGLAFAKTFVALY
jgi:hypothetical protein